MSSRGRAVMRGARGGPPSDRGRGGYQARGGAPPGEQRGGFQGRGRGGGPRGGDGGPVLYSPPGGAKAVPDERLQRARLADLLKRLNGVDRNPVMPVRRSLGSSGQNVVVRANMLRMHLPEEPIHEYSLKISPKPEAKRIRVELLDSLLETQILRPFKNQLAHDRGDKLYAATRLPIADGQGLEVPVSYSDPDDERRREPKTYNIEICFAVEHNPGLLKRFLEGDPEMKDWDPTPAISAYNVILSQAPIKAGGVRVSNKSGRENKYFFPGLGEGQLGGGIVALQGFFLSVRATSGFPGALMANVNVSTMTFYTTGPLADQLKAFRAANPSGNPDAFVYGLRVKTTHTGFNRTIRKLVRQKASEYMFDCDGVNMSVAQYIEQKCQVKLKDRHGECVDVSKPGGRAVVIPVELCWVLGGQVYRDRLSGSQTTAMLQIACRPPATNARRIMDEGIPRLGLDGKSAVANGFNIKFDKDLAVVPGRVLPRPTISYGGNATAKVNEKASWNLQNVKFARACAPNAIKQWGILVIREASGTGAFPGGPTDPGFIAVCKAFTDSMNQYGIRLPQHSFAVPAKLVPREQDDRLRRQSLELIRKALTGRQADFVLVLLANDDPVIYDGLKTLADVHLGIQTICSQTSKITEERGQPQYMANLALKLNAKFRGINHHVRRDGLSVLSQEKTMLVGIDVTHPSPNSQFGAPSIAAVVASVDDTFAQFPTGLRLQRGTKEMVFTELTDMMVERLVLYRDTNKQLPSRIVIFRDGVSEGQFKLVLQEELPAVRKACAKFSSGGKPYAPKLAIIICAKRHQTRFYPTELEVGGDTNGNTRPGSVVDVGATSMFGPDFFLQAHHALQGTAKPTHYTPILNEIGFSENDLQNIINALSYNFARATKAISLVTPAYCADLACERGRCYLREFLDTRGDDASSVRSADSEEVRQHTFDRANRTWGTGVHHKIKDTMFYL